MKRFVVDASTLVSGVASRPGGGAPWLILAALLDFEFEAIVCPKLIASSRTPWPTGISPIASTPPNWQKIAANVEEAAIVYDDPEEIEALLRDPDDDYLVALARESGADAIVTGDRDLLDHPDLKPQPLDSRAASRMLGLID